MLVMQVVICMSGLREVCLGGIEFAREWLCRLVGWSQRLFVKGFSVGRCLLGMKCSHGIYSGLEVGLGKLCLGWYCICLGFIFFDLGCFGCVCVFIVFYLLEMIFFISLEILRIFLVLLKYFMVKKIFICKTFFDC